MTIASPRPLLGTPYQYFDVKTAIDSLVPNAFEKMPYIARVFAENILRKAHGDVASVREPLSALANRRHDYDYPFYPARVVLQDLLGTPALVDLAGMRDAVAEARGAQGEVRFGHPSGTLKVGANAAQVNGEWTVTKAVMSRSARRLMEGQVFVPIE